MATTEPTHPDDHPEMVDVQIDDADTVVIIDTDDEPALESSLLARVGAEVVGTFALVLVTLATLLYAQLTGPGALGMALGAGLVLAAATAALGHVSGGHFNPAVSLGAAIAGRLSWLDMPVYWLSQLLGGIAAAALLFFTVPADLPSLLGQESARAFVGTTANGFDTNSALSTLSGGQIAFDLRAALLLELFAAAVFVALVLGATSRRSPRSVAPLAIGLGYAALLAVVAPVTNGGLNPARSTAAALFGERVDLTQLWLFWLAPLLGAAIAGLIYLANALAREDEVTMDDHAAFGAADDADRVGSDVPPPPPVATTGDEDDEIKL